MKFLKKNKKVFIITLSFVCIILMIVTVNFRTKPTTGENMLSYIVIPFEKIMTTISSYVDDKLSFFSNVTKIEDDNLKLTKKVNELEGELKRLYQMEEDNKVLSESLKVAQKYPKYDPLGARIIAKTPGNWFNIFHIDKGVQDKLQKNMVVLAADSGEGGLVGRIMEAGPNYSKVLSIIDDGSTVTAKSDRTKDRGYVRGDSQLMSEGLCVMEYIDFDAEIVEGDLIVTSELSQIFPPGIPIGYVREVETEAKGLTKRAIIQPFLDFKRLDTVLVINQSFEKSIDNLDMEEN